MSIPCPPRGSLMARDRALGGALVPQRGAWLRKSQGSCPWMLRLSLPAPPASSVPAAGRAGGARLHFRQPAARKPPGSPFPPGLERERSPCHFRGAPLPRPARSILPAPSLRAALAAARGELAAELPGSSRARARLSPAATRLNGSRGSARPLSPSPAAGGAEPASAPAPSPAARGAAAAAAGLSTS
ncbi:unnamed protein product [Lepidochelys kempii]